MADRLLNVVVIMITFDNHCKQFFADAISEMDAWLPVYYGN